MKIRIPQTLALALCAATLCLAGATASAVMLQGNPYTPPGSTNFQIVGLQGINTANPLGQSGFQTQVNTDFEFTPSIGVSYDTGGGHLTNFGLGLYSDAQHATQSTGLRINYTSAVLASSVTVTVEDFDIHLTDPGFNLTGKVAPTITLLGANNTTLASIGQADIFHALAPNTTHVDPHGHPISDVWDINFATLLSNLHITDSPITGFILAADMASGERANSDPYLLLSVGNGIPMVPEASNYLAGIAAIVFAGLFQLQQIRRRKKAVV